jgi:hypothetical protein
MPDRNYRVLALDLMADDAERNIYHDLGVHSGHDAKAAIEIALAEHGLPEGVKVCVGTPASNWNEHDVEPDPRPQFKVTPRKPGEADEIPKAERPDIDQADAAGLT